jgi:4-alpha-glucanotransferase
MSGIILHPSSLPGRHGIGELGAEACRFVDFLASSGQQIWQLLPLGPTQADDWHSPYSALSAFAGNPLLLSADSMQAHGLLDAAALADAPQFSDTAVEFSRVVEFKEQLFARASEAFRTRAPSELRDGFARFCEAASGWLDDYALFMALKQEQGKQWMQWDDALRRREPSALKAARERLAPAIFHHRFLQFEFDRQWSHVKRYANERGVKILGDMPIYVSLDSADVWARPELFQLSPDTLLPSVEAGVPPDMFSENGQHWGNPVYNWERIARDDYRWWATRFEHSFRSYDAVRIDHFRAFEAYWVIPRGAPPKSGRWEQGPGAGFFTAMRRQLPDLPITVEDIGSISPEIHALRAQFGFPSMFVLQFGFDGDASNPYLPFRCQPGFVNYTGTHDTNTAVGWYGSLGEVGRAALQDYLGAPSAAGVHWDMIRLAWASVAQWAIAPLQDVMGLGDEARMNRPGTVGADNWSWRFRWDSLSATDRQRLAQFTKMYGRASGSVR